MRLKGILFYSTKPILAVRRLWLALYEWRNPGEPWFSQGSVRFLEEKLKENMKVFEWGSGRSTLWFAQRVEEVVSVEYNQFWTEKVYSMIETSGAKNISLKYIPLEHDKHLPTPRHYDPIPQYVSEISNYPKSYFQLVIVDGHYRLTCVEEALDYISPGGYILVDNSNRVPREDWAVPMNWPLIHESENVVTRTSIWQKPF